MRMSARDYRRTVEAEEFERKAEQTMAMMPDGWNGKARRRDRSHRTITAKAEPSTALNDDNNDDNNRGGKLTWNEILRRNQQEQKAEPKPKVAHEHRLQVACVNKFREMYPQYFFNFFAIPNGGKRPTKTVTKKDGSVYKFSPEGKKLKDEGALKGVADLMLALPSQLYHGLFIEMKTQEKGSRQQDEQSDFQKAVEKAGFQYVICRSEEEFVRGVNQYITMGRYGVAQ